MLYPLFLYGPASLEQCASRMPRRRSVAVPDFAVIAPDEPVGRMVDEGGVGGECWA